MRHQRTTSGIFCCFALLALLIVCANAEDNFGFGMRYPPGKSGLTPGKYAEDTSQLQPELRDHVQVDGVTGDLTFTPSNNDCPPITLLTKEKDKLAFEVIPLWEKDCAESTITFGACSIPVKWYQHYLELNSKASPYDEGSVRLEIKGTDVVRRPDLFAFDKPVTVCEIKTGETPNEDGLYSLGFKFTSSSSPKCKAQLKFAGSDYHLLADSTLINETTSEFPGGTSANASFFTLPIIVLLSLTAGAIVLLLIIVICYCCCCSSDDPTSKDGGPRSVVVYNSYGSNTMMPSTENAAKPEQPDFELTRKNLLPDEELPDNGDFSDEDEHDDNEYEEPFEAGEDNLGSAGSYSGSPSGSYSGANASVRSGSRVASSTNRPTQLSHSQSSSSKRQEASMMSV